MDFIKKHYDKIILGAVALVVIGVLVFLPFVISSEQQQIKDQEGRVIPQNPKPLPPLNLTDESNIAQRVMSPASYDFTSTNKLFNPVPWKKLPDGSLKKINTWEEGGASAAVVGKITPLFYLISFDSVVTNAITPRYVVGVEKQAAAVPVMRRKQQRFVSLDDPKKDYFTLLSVIPKDATNSPNGLVLKLADTGDTVSIMSDKPYQRIDGYAADLRYDPDRKNFKSQRVGSAVSFAGGDYIVVAIDSNEVVLFDQTNQKKTTLRYAP